MVRILPVKTTITLKDEIYEYLVGGLLGEKFLRLLIRRWWRSFLGLLKVCLGLTRGLRRKALGMRGNPMKLLDSFAWIEYFMGSERGVKVRNYVDGLEPLYTPSI